MPRRATAVVLAAVLVLADAVLTMHALSRGAVEVNPLLSVLNGRPELAPAVAAAKVAGLALAWRRLDNRWVRYAVYIAAATHAAAVANGLVQELLLA